MSRTAVLRDYAPHQFTLYLLVTHRTSGSIRTSQNCVIASVRSCIVGN